MAKGKVSDRSVVAITKGGRWEAKRILAEGFDLLGGIDHPRGLRAGLADHEGWNPELHATRCRGCGGTG